MKLEHSEICMQPLQIEPKPGVHIEDLAEEMCALARICNCAVRSALDKRQLVALPFSLEMDVIKQWDEHASDEMAWG
jgi:hypothetical protein